MHLGCGLAVGMTGLAAGYCIGVVGDKGVRAYMEQSRVFVGMVLILIFGEVLGLYGYAANVDNNTMLSFSPVFMLTSGPSLIVALILNTKSRG
ncbi:hypothetical protein RRF57_008014 [Xylaria bambusicola]|uniref:V-ATPase proteolipid subunit C-like domain-containing protein n=1 Tax=Xylaria bambusicola TaxID=326684 RepID=A0AAN7Z0A6_9PEZI